MSTQRPPSGLGRPMSRSGAGRPPTAVRPPPTAIRVATGMVPGTSGHPAMRGGVPSPGVLSASIRVTERPVTQQGLSGMKTGMKGPQRQILDKSYYLGLLRSKVTELTAETSKLLKEIDNYNQENSVYLSYEKRAGGLAAEIKDLQGQLADHNMLVDKLNTSTEVEEMVNDYNTLKAQNDCENESMESIFTERREREESIRAADEQIQAERRVAEEAVRAMSSSKQQRYFSLTAANEELLQELSVVQDELDALHARREDYEEELSHLYFKQDVARLHESLSALEARRDAMEAEQKSQRSPEEERERMLQQVKEDNQEIASMDRQLSEIRTRVRQAGEELQHMDQGPDVAPGEYQQKYKELKRREEEIDRFQESFQETWAQEQDRTSRVQENIVSLLELCSRSMLRLRQVDRVSASELRNMQEVLLSKEIDVVQSENTAKGLSTESQQLQQDLDKVQQLEGKISGELQMLTERVAAMESELLVYRDLESLRRRADDKKQRLQADRVLLTRHRDSLDERLEENQRELEAATFSLQENETHAQLANLERKWKHLEQNNFVMKEFIASKSQESDYTAVASRVDQLVAEYNRMLIEALNNNNNNNNNRS